MDRTHFPIPKRLWPRDKALGLTQVQFPLTEDKVSFQFALKKVV